MTGTQADEDAEALLRIAVAAAAEAGRLLASWRGDERPEVVQTKSSPTDVVTEMDRRSEALITSRIRAHRPGRRRPGRGRRPDRGRPGRPERRGPGRGGCAGSSTRWTGPSTTCTACTTGRCPSRPRWTAPSWPGWSRCRGTARRSPRWRARAPGCTGAKPGWRCAVPRACRSARPWWGPGSAMMRGAAGCRARWSRRCCRTYGTSGAGGSAAVDLCSVAAGRLDAFYERGLNYWDFAAGGLIAREAGAAVGGLAGRAGEHLHGGGRRPGPVPAARRVPEPG